MENLDLSIADLVKVGGTLGAVLMFLRYLLLRDGRNEVAAKKREEDTVKKLTEVESFQRNQMTEMVASTTQVVAENSVALRDFGEVVKTCRQQSETRD